jgi:hypothetical protein
VQPLAVRLAAVVALASLLLAWWRSGGLARWSLQATGVSASREVRFGAVVVVGLWSLLWLAPTRPSPFDVFAAVAVIASVVIGFVPRRALIFAGLATALAAFGSARALLESSELTAPTIVGFAAADVLLLWVAVVAASLAARLTLSRPALVRLLTLALVVEALAVCVAGAIEPSWIVYRYARHPLGFARIDGFFTDPNVFAASHVVALALLLGFAGRGQRLLGASIATAAVVASGSRLAMAAAGFALLLTAVAEGVRRSRGGNILVRQRRATLGVSAGIALLACALVVAVVTASDGGHLFGVTLPDALLRPYDSDRFDGWRRAFSAFSPWSALFGNGTLAADRAVGMTSPHLTLARVMVDQGLLYWAAVVAALVAIVATRIDSIKVDIGRWWLWLPPCVLLAATFDVNHLRVLYLIPMLLLAVEAPARDPLVAARQPLQRARFSAGAAVVTVVVVALLTAAGFVVAQRLLPPPAATAWRVQLQLDAPTGATIDARRSRARAMVDTLGALALESTQAAPRFLRGSAGRAIVAHGTRFRVDVPNGGPSSPLLALAEVVCAPQPAATQAFCRAAIARISSDGVANLADLGRWQVAQWWRIAAIEPVVATERAAVSAAAAAALGVLAGLCALLLSAFGWLSVRRLLF